MLGETYCTKSFFLYRNWLKCKLQRLGMFIIAIRCIFSWCAYIENALVQNLNNLKISHNCLWLNLHFNILHNLLITFSYSHLLLWWAGHGLVRSYHHTARASREATSQPKFLMDVSDDEHDEALLKLNEDKLRELQKANSIQCIESMRNLFKEVSKFDILLCQMVYMPLIHPTLTHNIKRLEAEFTHVYQQGVPIFYVSITNKLMDERFVKDVDTNNWSLH